MDRNDALARAAATVSRSGDTVVVVLAGEVDLSNVEEIERNIERALPASPGPIIFELRDLEFLDSAGIGLLVRYARRSERIELHEPRAAVRRLIELTGLQAVLPMS